MEEYYENDHTTQSDIQVQCNLYQNSNGIFTEIEKTILEFVWNHKSFQVAKEIWRKKNKAGCITFLDIKVYYKAMVIKTVWHWNKEKPHRIESPEINLYIYMQLIFDRDSKNTQRGKIVSSINGVEKTGYPHTKE